MNFIVSSACVLYPQGSVGSDALIHGCPGDLNRTRIQLQIWMSLRDLKARRSLERLKPGGLMRAAEVAAGSCLTLGVKPSCGDRSWGGGATLSSILVGGIAKRAALTLGA